MIYDQIDVNDIKYPYKLAVRGNTTDEYPTTDGGETAKVNDAYRHFEDPDAKSTKTWVAA